MTDLLSLVGGIDIYLFDQILRGHVVPGASVLDAGCGAGRNLVWFLREGHPVRGLDADPAAIRTVRELAARLAPDLPATDFRVEPVEANSFPDAAADVVLSSAVLHFARDEAHFEAMLRGTWRLLAPGGLFFARLASSIGMDPARLTPLGGGRHVLPDGSTRFLVTEEDLLAWTERLGGRLVDPLKTTVVQGARCMTTWVVRRSPASGGGRGPGDAS